MEWSIAWFSRTILDLGRRPCKQSHLPSRNVFNRQKTRYQTRGSRNGLYHSHIWTPSVSILCQSGKLQKWYFICKLTAWWKLRKVQDSLFIFIYGTFQNWNWNTITAPLTDAATIQELLFWGAAYHLKSAQKMRFSLKS